MAAERAVVFVIDDDPSMRHAIEDLVASVGLEPRVFATPQEFLQAKRADAPSCLVLDVRLPGTSGLAFQEALARAGVPLPVIFITGHGDIPMSVRAIKAGAVEFLCKPFREQELLDAVHAGIERNRVQRQATAAVAELQQRFATLTEREREVMALVIAGHANKRIAAKLGVAEGTVKVHRGQIMRKMHAQSVQELVRIGDLLTKPKS
jgi:FixJ family two-component response regulator